MTYETWYRQYMTLYKTDIAPKTAESYEHCYATYIAPTLAAVELEAVTPDDLQSIVMQAFFEAEAAKLKSCMRSFTRFSPVQPDQGELAIIRLTASTNRSMQQGRAEPSTQPTGSR